MENLLIIQFRHRLYKAHYCSLDRIKLIIVACYPYTVIVNRTVRHSDYYLKDSEHIYFHTVRGVTVHPYVSIGLMRVLYNI